MKEKLKKLQLKGFAAGILVMILLTPIILTANPAGEVVMRELHYGVNVVVNGRPLQTEGIDRPFILDGRTFLPVSTIAQALNVPANWDGATRTVYIGGAPGQTARPLFEIISTTGSSNFTVGSHAMSGTQYNSVISTNTHNSNNPWTAGWGEFNLNGQFSAISGSVGRINNGTAASTIRFIGDGRELATFNIDGTVVPRDISVDVSGVLVLRIEFNQPAGGAMGGNRTQIGFANPMIH